jgi:hypothetical protein
MLPMVSAAATAAAILHILCLWRLDPTPIQLGDCMSGVIER